ncbi:putative vacuolar sorting protein (hbrA) [Mycosarcoma maydis]|uniref:Vacuolar sorting protein (HbrA) n=1 Tax=Mycosarcoma maydis TaxID=5270 RepID=A0A0D1E469_MYCMD|nr:putative vacuolar sorting protein (hbrA) [Ustilago maydis 521]KIS69265.1 putative vacuolar sorting protein (hbrA) [Ustilago maydis 521]|eukprot:XP_011389170.1 putative vacuolar sorting protein (hbrA) [Ustilago maydis 521]
MASAATASRQAGPTAAPSQTPASNSSPTTAPSAMAPPILEPWDGLDTRILTDLARRGLMSTLDTIKEAKTLMLDPSLAGPLGLVADVSSLKQHGVEKMFWLEPASAAFVTKNDAKHSQAQVKAGLKFVNAPTKSVVYICRPEIKWMKAIAEHLRADRSVRPTSPLQHTYTISFVPHRTEPCLQFLDQEAVLSDVSLLDFGLEFVPLDHDLISLEDETAWKRIYCDGDHTPIFRSAQALMTLQHAYGLFPRILGKGALARRLADLLIRQRREHLASDPSSPALTAPSHLIDSLIIIDRAVDYATPLCTQLTYEGLVDEVVGINNGHVEVDPALLTGHAQTAEVGAQPHASGSGTPLQMTSAPKKRKHRLDASTDLLFAEIRNLNFAVVGDCLHRAAKRLNQDYEGRHQAKTVSQIRAFVGKLGGLQSEHACLRLHTGLTEKIMEWTSREEFNRMLEVQQNSVAGLDLPAQYQAIEDMVNEERDLVGVLRLLCLTSVVGLGSTAGGIKAKNLEFVKREILQTYGYQHLPLLLALQKVGLLTRASAIPATSSTGGFGGALSSVVGVGNSSANAAGDSESRGSAEEGGKGGFASVRRSLRLINDDVDERAPTDISYVYSGYAPLSIRLVQAIAQKEALLDPSRSDPNAKPVRAVKPRAHPIVGWRGFDDAVNQLPGATFDEIQSGSMAGNTGSNAELGQGASSSGAASLLPPTDPDAVTSTLVFFLGGVTYTELAALRFMNAQTRNRRFVVATTNTINGNKMINDLAETRL